MKEQLREDQQELKTFEQKKKATDARRIRGIVHENNKSKGTNHVQAEMVKLMHHDEQELLSLWVWMTTKAGVTSLFVCFVSQSRSWRCLLCPCCFVVCTAAVSSNFFQGPIERREMANAEEVEMDGRSSTDGRNSCQGCHH